MLAAWGELRDDFRHFRANRIVACHETGDSFADLAPQLRRDWRARPGMRRARQGPSAAITSSVRVTMATFCSA